jgi:hypothetical protein
VVDKAENKPISTDDRNYLIGKRFNDWYNALDPTSANVSTDGLTDKLRQFAIDRATKYVQKFQG